VNDSMRYYLRSKDGSISLFNEGLAGAVAGFSQVIVTSPMEMFKIQLQLQVCSHWWFRHAEKTNGMSIYRQPFLGRNRSRWRK